MSKKEKSKGFIRYTTQVDGGSEYGTYCRAERVGGNKTNNDVWLGRVVDKKKGVFYNRKQGYFLFSIDGGMVELTDEEQASIKLTDRKKRKSALRNNSQIIDFGQSFFFNELLKITGLLDVFRQIAPKGSADTLLSLIGYKFTGTGVSCHAIDWWERSYSKFLYPDAKLQSQRISEFMAELGDEEVRRNFLSRYHSHLNSFSKKKRGGLIDSTGIKNNINIYLTRSNVHNGVRNTEFRVIVVLDKDTEYPLYYKHIPGNVVDVTTLRTTLAEIGHYDICLEEAIMDAGYYGEENIHELFETGTKFIIRLAATNNIYKSLISEHYESILDKENMFIYAHRPMSVIKKQIDLYGHEAWAYVTMDFNRHCDEMKQYACGNCESDISSSEFRKKMLSSGMFILVTSHEMDYKEVLPFYYTRQGIEQFFDFAKNDVSFAPARVHNVGTLRGHLMLSFMASIVQVATNRKLGAKKKNKLSSQSTFDKLLNFHANVYSDAIIPDIYDKHARFMASCFGVEIPIEIPRPISA
jgi:hypothetical protein